MQKELRPCPFCGSEAMIFRTYILFPKWNEYYVKCLECPAVMSGFNREQDAREAWNKRKNINLINILTKDDLEKIISES